ncbi:hypothetical protein C8J57DRAFT_433163 [Mycena rebaudengoi]|nr:hypothetical protein C8J57DRAFT_433163 [Mycena rebaudengoi]
MRVEGKPSSVIDDVEGLRSKHTQLKPLLLRPIYCHNSVAVCSVSRDSFVAWGAHISESSVLATARLCAFRSRLARGVLTNPGAAFVSTRTGSNPKGRCCHGTLGLERPLPALLTFVALLPPPRHPPSLPFRHPRGVRPGRLPPPPPEVGRTLDLRVACRHTYRTFLSASLDTPRPGCSPSADWAWRSSYLIPTQVAPYAAPLPSHRYAGGTPTLSSCRARPRLPRARRLRLVKRRFDAPGCLFLPASASPVSRPLHHRQCSSSLIRRASASLVPRPLDLRLSAGARVPAAPSSSTPVLLAPRRLDGASTQPRTRRAHATTAPHPTRTAPPPAAAPSPTRPTPFGRAEFTN